MLEWVAGWWKVIFGFHFITAPIFISIYVSSNYIGLIKWFMFFYVGIWMLLAAHGKDLLYYPDDEEEGEFK